MNVAINLADDYILVVRPPGITPRIRNFGVDGRYLVARAPVSGQRTSRAADVATHRTLVSPTGRSSESEPRGAFVESPTVVVGRLQR